MEPLIIKPEKDNLTNFLNKEWLCADGLGGYASGTILGVNTRRGHGLFVPYVNHLKSREVLVSNLVESANGSNLSGFEFIDGTISSQAGSLLNDFQLDYAMPVWNFMVDGSTIEKKIITPRGQNVTLIRYRLLNSKEIKISLTPYLTFFAHGSSLSKEKDFFSSLDEQGRGIYLYYSGFDKPVTIKVHGVDHSFTQNEKRLSSIFYREEYERGNEPTDLLLNPGSFDFTLGEKPVVVSLAFDFNHDYEGMLESFEAQKKRIQVSLEGFKNKDDLTKNLIIAAESFIFNKSNEKTEKNEPRWSILAGFHWFLDWGRDAMISLEGLVLCARHFDKAKNILRTLSKYINNGLLFNSFNDGQSAPSFNSADASLWFFHALNRYYLYTKDAAAIEEFYPVLAGFLDAYVKGTAPGIKVDPDDGLIRISSEYEPLTWMDAQIYG